MVTKYNIGDMVQIHATVEAITILEDDIRYRLKIDGKPSFIDCDTLYIPEKDIGGKLVSVNVSLLTEKDIGGKLDAEIGR